MARQVGAFPFSGKVSELVGYRRGEGHFLRAYRPITEKEWRESKRLVRSRENAYLFGGASKLASGLYGSLPESMRGLRSGYGHNQLTSRILKMAKLIPDVKRLPELYAAEYVGLAVLGQEMALLKVGQEDHEGWAQAQARRQMRLAFAGEVLSFKGLGECAKQLRLKAGERLEFRLHVGYIRLGGIVLNKERNGYNWEGGGTRSLGGVNSIWMPVGGVEGDLEMAVGEYGELKGLEKDGVVLVMAGVEWRAVKGGRIRYLRGATTLQAVGMLGGKAVAKPIKKVRKKRVRRYRGGDRKMDLAMRVAVGMKGLARGLGVREVMEVVRLE